ncbi:nitrite reductase small subunit [Enterovibrio norvegicus]|jgi:nitrite reductase (NADH) small subunit|uniref:Nitrite reductase (NADH) small subunit n=1 Tax=Enterovibrio norvegicus DSM 15893 TaxID=1121869 RepID=A0A1I5JT32_9GAMM|nr:nitrite reductase small subunit NirD [Enterovibrio norvegicus]MCC4797388.1 nitrite reductase small subunit NirD [Enterovibrio norvegicus]OEE55651.1 nitrite reductase small subunit [Enterovibrio norvegicus]PMH66734.1 nitrite reductase small subunit [Enterovibrio norvegicus]PMI27104.1 nitrite reductase small subunit [Enterovibrio norvegicus]PMN56020.1 nitrite reductase small subunit [Enterovibrio norvegicus]
MYQWQTICDKTDLVENTGICALFNDKQVAIFLCGKTDTLYAIDNFDPIGKANVLSRGLLGSIGEKTVIASPLYKQHFCLTSGECIEDESVSVITYPVRQHDGAVQLGTLNIE